MRLTPNGPGNISESGLKFQQYPIIYLDDEAGETDTKPDIEGIHGKKPNVDEPPPLKIRKIESINNDLEQQHKIPANNQIHTTPLVTKDEPLKEQIEQTRKTITYVQKAPARSPNEMCQNDQPNSVKIKEETLEDNYILPTNTIVTVTPPPQQLKEQQVHQLASPTSPSTVQQHHQFPPPPQTSSHQAENHDSEELPRSVTCFKDVLLLLKPLEEYAMLKENYRAIGLITQLEGVLINEPESNLGLPLKSLTLEERIKILRIFDKVPSCSKLAQLLGISYNAIGCIMNNRDEMIENYNKHSKSEESEQLDTIIIPSLMLKIRKEHKPPINPRIIKMIELLGECVCEALKRQQNFSRAWITKRTSEFYDIMQLNHFEFPVYWFQYVRCEYKLRLANKEESLKYATLPVEVDLNEILTFCINKMVENKNDEAESLENSYSSNNDPQDLIRSFDQSSSLGAEHLQITSYSDVLKMLKPLKDFAALCANNEGLEYISALEQHIKNQ